MNKSDEREVDLRIREYFDHFMAETFPKLMDAHTNKCPHGLRVNKLRWIGIGVLVGVGLLTTPTIARFIIPLI
jgi:hypothetical protein